MAEAKTRQDIVVNILEKLLSDHGIKMIDVDLHALDVTTSSIFQLFGKTAETEGAYD